MEKIIIILVLMLSLNLKAQIKDGSYIEIARGDYYIDVVIEIRHDSIKKCEYSTIGKDSTFGKYKIARDFLLITWNKQPISPGQIKVYKNPNGFNSKSFTIIVQDKNKNYMPGVNIIEEKKGLGMTDMAGRFSISKEVIPKKLKFSFVGKHSIEFDCDTLSVNNLDSLVIKLNEGNQRYIERPDEKTLIRDINAHGFELFRYNCYIQYLRLDFFNKLSDSGVILRKTHFTEEEYANILKY